MKYSFAGFTYDPEAGCFFGERRMPLSRLECRVLGLLLDYAGRIVTKDEFAVHAWHCRCVSDESIARAVHSVRRNLGAHSAERVVDTVYARGYRLAVAVQRITAPAMPPGPAAASTTEALACVRDLRETLRLANSTEFARVASKLEHVERLLAGPR